MNFKSRIPISVKRKESSTKLKYFSNCNNKMDESKPRKRSLDYSLCNYDKYGRYRPKQSIDRKPNEELVTVYIPYGMFRGIWNTNKDVNLDIGWNTIDIKDLMKETGWDREFILGVFELESSDSD